MSNYYEGTGSCNTHQGHATGRPAARPESRSGPEDRREPEHEQAEADHDDRTHDLDVAKRRRRDQLHAVHGERRHCRQRKPAAQEDREKGLVVLEPHHAGQDLGLVAHLLREDEEELGEEDRDERPTADVVLVLILLLLDEQEGAVADRDDAAEQLEDVDPGVTDAEQPRRGDGQKRRAPQGRSRPHEDDVGVVAVRHRTGSRSDLGLVAQLTKEDGREGRTEEKQGAH